MSRTLNYIFIIPEPKDPAINLNMHILWDYFKTAYY